MTKKEIKTKIENVRPYIWFGGFMLALTTGVILYAGLPARVEAVELQTEKAEDAVEKLSQTVEKYIAVQAERAKGQEKREELMLRLIADIRGESD